MDTRAGSGFVTGALGYIVPPAHRPFNYMFQPPDGTPWQNCEYEQRYCRIHNARQIPSAVSLESSGFELLDAPTGVDDFYDERKVSEIYCREVEELALRITGGIRAAVFDHQLRRREPGRTALSFGRDGGGAEPAAVGRVHNDYTETSGRRRLHLELPDAAPDHPFMILNFWRPVLYPALDTPLAVCDARSFPMTDWVTGDVIYPARTGEIYLGKYSDAHSWYYYPAMAPAEVLVFKTYDSRLDHPARMTPHCAFDDPSAAGDAPPRRSIEMRCLVILD
jgi:hypothetical protein